VRRKLEETFGQFEIGDERDDPAATAEETLIRTFTDATAQRRLVEVEYRAVGEDTSIRVVEPYALERRLPYWYVHTWDRTRAAERSFRLDRMKRAEALDDRFEPREGFEPRELAGARTATVLYSPAVARWRLERTSAVPLADGSALEEVAVGSTDWLVCEVLSYRGEATVVEPPDLREHVAARARALRETLAATGARR
jgi:predicted DNA-binding transcriptional regulator YafY